MLQNTILILQAIQKSYYLISETEKKLPVKIQIKIQYGSMTLLLKEVN